MEDISNKFKKPFSFLNLANEVLQQSATPMTPDEIWQYASNAGISSKLNSSGKTPWQTLSARLYTFVKAKPGELFFRADGSPTRFGLVGKHEGLSLSGYAQEPEVLSVPIKSKIGHERDLHPYLAHFAAGVMEDVTVKTIYHEKSKKLPFGEWLHPDIVGVKLLSKSWAKGAREIAQSCGGSITRLYSFELKRQLNEGNLRESFFQCVSNSSWANEAWLVTAELKKTNEFERELKRLAGRFGIGVIELNIENPSDSSIHTQARYREDIDWETVTKLAEHNPDFQEFLNDVRLSVSENSFVTKHKFDPVMELDELMAE